MPLNMTVINNNPKANLNADGFARCSASSKIWSATTADGHQIAKAKAKATDGLSKLYEISAVAKIWKTATEHLRGAVSRRAMTRTFGMNLS